MSSERISDKKGYRQVIIIGIIAAFMILGATTIISHNVSATGNTIYVGSPGGYSKIQDAIDNASDGDTIIVAAGTYNEQLIINKNNLSIQSEYGAANTIINATGQGTSYGGVVFEADGCTFEGFTVIDYSNESYENKIIRINGDNNTIRNNIIQGNLNQPVSDQTEYGILFQSTASENLIENNEVYDIGYIGINIAPDSGTHNNMIRNNYVHDIGIYAITVDRSPNNTVTQNTISNLVGGTLWGIYYDPNTYCWGIVVWGANSAGTLVTQQNITNLPNGIVLSSAQNVTIENCNISNNDNYGVRISYTGWVGDRPENNTIINNNICNNKVGIYITNGTGSIGPFNIIHCNNIYGNTEMGLNNTSPSLIDAKYNWWGSNTGPHDDHDASATLPDYNNSDGLGDNVTSYVKYKPWLNDTTPPIQTIEIGNPKVQRVWRSNLYDVVGPYTPIWINSTDRGDCNCTCDIGISGSHHITYSVWLAPDLNASQINWQHLPQYDTTVYDGDDRVIDGKVHVVLYLNETCLHQIRYQCWDYEGNSDGMYSKDLFVDKCPPTTNKTVGCPEYGAGIIQPPWSSGETPILFKSSDKCCLENGTGVHNITIMVWWKPDTCNSSGPTNVIETIVVEDQSNEDLNDTEGVIEYEYHFKRSGFYELEWWGTDNVGNSEEHWKQQHRVDIEPPIIEKTHPSTGYYPLGERNISFLYEDNFEGVDGGTSSWSTDDTTSHLNTNSWSLLNGDVEVSAYADGNSANLTHRGTRGLGVEGGEPDEIDVRNIDGAERIEITFSRPYHLSYFEVRSLFSGEEGDVSFWLDGQQVGYYHLVGVETLGSGNGVVGVNVNFSNIANTIVDGTPTIIIDKIVFYIDQNAPYASHSTYAVAGLKVKPAAGYLKCNTPFNLDVNDMPNTTCNSGLYGMYWRYEWDSDNDGQVEQYPQPGDAGAVNGTDITDYFCIDAPNIDNYWWYSYGNGIQFPLDCQHDLYYFAIDNVGNYKWIFHQIYYVDNTPPEVYTEPGNPYCCETLDSICVKTTTPIWINASDDTNNCQAGVESIFWRYKDDDGQWWPRSQNDPYDPYPQFGVVSGENLYYMYGDLYGPSYPEIYNHYWYYVDDDTVKFYWNEECNHTLHYFAKDNVCNRSEVHEYVYHVDDSPPTIIKTVGEPNCTHYDPECDDCGQLQYDEYCVTTDTLITLNAFDNGCCPCSDITIEYRIDSWNGVSWDLGTWQIYTSSFTFPKECKHRLVVRAYDCLGNGKDDAYWDTEIFYVNDHTPVIEKTVGEPNCTKDVCGADYCVKTTTPIWFNYSYDSCCPCDVTFEYRVWNDTYDSGWQPTYNGYKFYFSDECFHHLDLRAYDCLGHITYDNETFYVDNKAPKITKTVGDPNISGTGNPDYWVSCETPITIDAQDQGCCGVLEKVLYQINQDGWVDITDSLPFTLHFDEDCVHDLHIKAIDCLGNTAYDDETFYVDCTPPRVTKEISGPQCSPFFVTNQTRIWINATDEGIEPCIVGSLHLKVGIWYNNVWTYTWYNVTSGSVNLSFTFEEAGVGDDCVHYVTYWAKDDLGNAIPEEDNETFYVDNTPPVSSIHYKGVVPGWKQMNEEGFGDLTNDYAWGMAVYNIDGANYLYVGTLNSNYTGDPSEDGCEIWRTDGTLTEDKKYVWEQVVGPSGTQMPAGFGMGIPGVRNMIVYDGLLWVGCLGEPTSDDGITLVGENCTLWVTDGTTWKQANHLGFDHEDQSIRGMAVFDGKLYIGTEKNINGDGANLYRYTGGAINGDINNVDPSAWEQVFNVTADESPTFSVLKEFNGYLYIGTIQVDFSSTLDGNVNLRDGAEIYRSSTGDLGTWEKVVGDGAPVPAGFGNENNTGILSIEVFNGKLYVGTYNFINRAELWRTSDGLTWEPVILNGNGHLNFYIWSMLTYDGELFAGTMNPIAGCELWKSSSGDMGTWERANVNGMDGETMFSPPVSFFYSGLLADQYGIRNMVEYDGHLIVGTASFAEFADRALKHLVHSWPGLSQYVGCEIWRINGSNLHVAREYINCSTRIYINASDVGIDPCISDHWVIHYRVWYDGHWTNWNHGGVNENISFTMGDFGFAQDCKHIVEYYAEDCLGNEEYHHLRTIYVDCTPPEFLILKPKDGWYSDGSSIPSVVLAEDPWVKGCSSGIEEENQGFGYLIDVFPGFKVVPLDSSNFLYDYESHEYIGNLGIPDPSGLPDGAVLFVAGGEDNVGNGGNSIITLIHSYFLQWVAEHGPEDVEAFADWLNDIVTNFNVVVIGIDNTPPEVEIVEPEDGSDIGLGPVTVEAEVFDALSGVNHGTTAQVYLAGVYIGELTYNEDTNMWDGTLSIALDIPDGEQNLTVTIPDLAGNIGSDTITVIVGERPGPTTSGTDVQPDPSKITVDGIGEDLTVTATIHSTISTIQGAEYFISDTKPDKTMWGTGTALAPVSGQNWGSTMVDVYAEFNTDGWKPGTYTIWVHGKDAYGRWGAFDEEEFNIVLETHWRPIYCEFVEPEEDSTHDITCEICCERYVTAIVDVHYWDDWTYSDMSELIGNVKIWLDSPYGAPDQYFDVTWDPSLQKFTAKIPVYMYSTGSILDLEAKAQDQYGNKEYDDVQFTVITTVIFDQWMEKGWNSLTLPDGSITCDDSVESVLASINNGNFNIVSYYNEMEDKWYSYVYGEPTQTLNKIETGKEYWINITGEPVRFYVDTNPPYIEITEPIDSARCEGPSSLSYKACDLETEVTMVYTQIYDQNTGLYWDGTNWVENSVWLECDFDSQDDGWTYWEYNSEGIWTSGHTYDISAYATDAGGCGSETVTHTLHIYKTSILVEKTVGDGQKQLTTSPDTPFTFTIYVENTGDTTLSNIDITDYLSDSFTYLDDAKISINDDPFTNYEPDHTENDDHILYWYTGITMNPGDHLVITFDASISSCGIWEKNIAIAEGASICGSVSDTDYASVYGECPEPCNPDMEVTKLVWNASKRDWADEYTASYLKEIVEFNITIHNNAECCDLTNISVLDILPNGLEYYSTCGVYYDDILLTPEGNYTFEENNGYLWWNFTNDGLASSVPYCHHIYIYFSAQVTGTGDLINRVKVTVDCGDTKDICESDDAVVNYEEQPCEPTYSVTKETWCYSSQMWWSYGYARSNDNHAKFRIRFNNTGTCDITDKIIIKDELPIELYYNNEYNIVAPSGITIDENEIYYNPSTHTVYFNFTGILQPGENITLILEADYDGDGSSGYEENWVYGSLEETTPIPAHSGIYFNKLGDQ